MSNAWGSFVVLLNIFGHWRLILMKKHYLTKTINYEFIIVYHRRYTHHRMGIGRIRVLCLRADTRITGFSRHRHNFRITAKTNGPVNFRKSEMPFYVAFYLAFCPSENQLPESSLNRASNP